MKNKVLYFPHINVPNSIWFTRMLLYWDEVGAIVLYEFIEMPERLDEHTRSLVKANLVTQVIPGQYIREITNYEMSFVNYLESLGKKLDKRRKSFRKFFKKRRYYKVHIEKMDQIGYLLEDIGLARGGAPWYKVEEKTAKEFMAYLAGTLGKLAK